MHTHTYAQKHTGANDEDRANARRSCSLVAPVLRKGDLLFFDYRCLQWCSTYAVIYAVYEHMRRVCICTYIRRVCTYEYVCICAFIHTYIHACMHTYIHIYIMHAYIHAYTHTYIFIHSFIHSFMDAGAHTACICMHTRHYTCFCCITYAMYTYAGVHLCE